MLSTRSLAAALASVLAGALLLTGAAAAAPTLDQQQTTLDMDRVFVIGGESQQTLAQIVTSGTPGLLTQVDLPVACDSSNLLVEIRESGTTIPARASWPRRRSAGSRTPKSGSRSRSALPRSSRTRASSQSCSRPRAGAGSSRDRTVSTSTRGGTASTSTRPIPGAPPARISASRRTSKPPARSRRSSAAPSRSCPARSRHTAALSGRSRSPSRETCR